MGANSPLLQSRRCATWRAAALAALGVAVTVAQAQLFAGNSLRGNASASSSSSTRKRPNYDSCATVFEDLFPDGADCRRYVYCWKGKPYYFKCHTGFAFDPCALECVRIYGCGEADVCACTPPSGCPFSAPPAEAAAATTAEPEQRLGRLSIGGNELDPPVPNSTPASRPTAAVASFSFFASTRQEPAVTTESTDQPDLFSVTPDPIPAGTPAAARRKWTEPAVGGRPDERADAKPIDRQDVDSILGRVQSLPVRSTASGEAGGSGVEATPPAVQLRPSRDAVVRRAAVSPHGVVRFLNDDLLKALAADRHQYGEGEVTPTGFELDLRFDTGQRVNDGVPETEDAGGSVVANADLSLGQTGLGLTDESSVYDSELDETATVPMDFDSTSTPPTLHPLESDEAGLSTTESVEATVAVLTAEQQRLLLAGASGTGGEKEEALAPTAALGPCEEHALRARLQLTAFELKAGKPVHDAYVPQCDDDGGYRPLQHNAAGDSWCVETGNGREVPGTRLVIARGVAKCADSSAPGTDYTRIPDVLRRLQSTVGARQGQRELDTNTLDRQSRLSLGDSASGQTKLLLTTARPTTSSAVASVDPSADRGTSASTPQAPVPTTDGATLVFVADMGMMPGAAANETVDEYDGDDEMEAAENITFSMNERLLPEMCNLTSMVEHTVCECGGDRPPRRLLGDEADGRFVSSPQAVAQQSAGVDCSTLVCRNGGMYLALSTGHCGCVCPQGYMGSDCGDLVDRHRCNCANGGVCVSLRPPGSANYTAYACECPLGYIGARCEYGVDDVLMSAVRRSARSLVNGVLHLGRLALCGPDAAHGYCYNGGICVLEMAGGGQRQCYCANNFAGPRCEYQLVES